MVYARAAFAGRAAFPAKNVKEREKSRSIANTSATPARILSFRTLAPVWFILVRYRKARTQHMYECTVGPLGWEEKNWGGIGGLTQGLRKATPVERGARRYLN